MPLSSVPLWERPELRRITGGPLRPGGTALTQHAVRCAKLPAGSQILDIGCGLGASMSTLREDCGMKPIGIDARFAQLQSTTDMDAQAQTVQAQAEALPFADASFDAVNCECVFSLVQDKVTCLREIRRVLRPSGVLLLSDLVLRTHQTTSQSQSTGQGCASRALDLPQTLEHLERTGFSLLLLEDHSRCLAELAAQLIFADCLPEEFRNTCCRPGYALLLAQTPSKEVHHEQ